VLVTVRSWLVLLLSVIYAITSFSRTENAFGQSISFPALGVWNGFNEHVNVLECSNADRQHVILALEIRSNSGAILGRREMLLPAGGTSHVVLNEYNITDQYGTYLLDVIGGDAALVSCLTAIYRYARPERGKSLDYAFVHPVRSPQTGKSFGVYNSLNPAVESGPVFNWLSVYNAGESPFNADVKLYNQDGALIGGATRRIARLPAGNRIDLPLGHDIGQIVGLYEISPDSSFAPYGAFLSRYSKQPDYSYAFAFTLEAKQPSCLPTTLPASTMGNALNWGELANPSSATVSVELKVRDQTGSVLHQAQLDLAPVSQQHIPLHHYLGEDNIGSFDVHCLPG